MAKVLQKKWKKKDLLQLKGKEKQKGVMIFDKNKEDYLNSLHEVLKSDTYKTSTYTVFTIYEPKERIIYRLPFFPDRIVKDCLMARLGKTF